MRRAIISGVTGHLGREVARQLLAEGVEVHGFTRRGARTGRSWNSAVELHELDGRTDALVDVLAGIQPDTVFHLAAHSCREHGVADVVPLVESNILFGTQLLEGARAVGCMRFVVAGSYYQYFGQNECRALNLYAATKQAFEDILAYYVDAYEIAAASLILCDVYSEGDERQKLMNVIADAWSEGMPLKLPDEEFWLDLVHVEDVAGAFLRVAALLEGEAAPQRAIVRYSVCSGRDITPTELVALFERLGQRKLIVKRGEYSQPSRWMREPWRGVVVPGWAPRITIEEGISRILAHRRRESCGNYQNVRLRT